jgi:hypothetical protein
MKRFKAEAKNSRAKWDDNFELQLYNYKLVRRIIILKISHMILAFEQGFREENTCNNFELQIYNYKWVSCIIIALCTEDLSYDPCH